MAWIAAHWPALLSILSMALGLVIAVLHLAGQNKLAESLKSVEDLLDQINQKKPDSTS